MLPEAGSTCAAHLEKSCSAAPVAAAAEQDFSKWAAQVDPASGNTYYYHTETLATSWVWPPEKAMA